MLEEHSLVTVGPANDPKNMPRKIKDKRVTGRTQPEISLDFRLAEFLAGRDTGGSGGWTEASFARAGSRGAAPLDSGGAADVGEAA